MNNRNSYNKNSKGFYIALSVSLIAVIAATIGITYTTRKIKVDTGITSTTVDWDNNSYTIPENPANNDSEDVPDDRYTTQPEPAETEPDEPAEDETEPSNQETATTEKNISCALPMGTRILKDYSNGAMVKSKTMNDWRLHNGVDFSGEFGDEIKSVSDGTVSNVYTDPMWGKVIEIRHDGKMSAKYCGFDEINVNEGDIVAKEQILGTLGTIPVESADNTHLHLEITVNGETVDPIEALGRDNPTE